MKTTIAILAAISMAGCATPDVKLKEYRTYEAPTSATVRAYVRWVPDPNVTCRKLGYKGMVLGCAVYEDNIKACIIYAKRPADFNDNMALTVLGHEFLHCLGARHEPH